MLYRLRPVELYETGSSDRVDGFSGRIGNEMKVKSRHRQQTIRPMCTIR
jgi:hypothetical protein